MAAVAAPLRPFSICNVPLNLSPAQAAPLPEDRPQATLSPSPAVSTLSARRRGRVALVSGTHCALLIVNTLGPSEHRWHVPFVNQASADARLHTLLPRGPVVHPLIQQVMASCVLGPQPHTVTVTDLIASLTEGQSRVLGKPVVRGMRQPGALTMRGMSDRATEPSPWLAICPSCLDPRQEPQRVATPRWLSGGSGGLG